MEPKNLLQVFKITSQKQAHLPCFRFKENGQWQAMTWESVSRRILDVAGGLKKLGAKKGDRISIFSRTLPEWSIVDMGILANGSISVPIYESSTAEAAEYILNNAEVQILFVDTVAQLNKIKKVRNRLPLLKQIIVLDSENLETETGLYTIEQLEILGSGEGEAVFNKMVKELGPDDVASLVYTSGTTGPPKGVVLTHENFISEIISVGPIFHFKSHQVCLLFLPLAHIFARVMQFAQFYYGYIQAYAESIDKLLDNIAEAKPDLMGSVPRIFEKVHARVIQGVESGSPAKKKIFEWAMKIGTERNERRRLKKAVSPALHLKWLIAYKLVFSKLHERMGGNLSFFLSGGAPLSREIAEFFQAAGLIILEGYGLTETTAAITCNDLHDYKMGVVGKPVKGVEVKIAPDGEILARGKMIFKGYYKKPEETAQVLDADGWFHTGDIGVFDSEGFLKITDRKKDIIVTAGGKNIAPQNIENFIKNDPLISQVMVHGDNRKFLSALITLDKVEVEKIAKQQKIPYSNYGELIKSSQLEALIRAKIDEKNKQLAKYETIKKFAILEDDFSVESGELTPTMKVKRKFTSEKYRHILEDFYKE